MAGTSTGVAESRWILHVDMDAFFVAVELLDDPSLRGRPVVVGGAGSRGVVAAASYEARAFGVGSAMPSVRARRLCPEAVFLPGRFWRYQELSAEVFCRFRDVTPLVEGISLDEAFLDVTGRARVADAPALAAELRERIAVELGLPCSVGVAPRKLTAKLASEAAKPRATPNGPVPGAGVVVVQPSTEIDFLHAHPARALWGVGPVTGRRLDQLGVRTVGDLAAVPLVPLEHALGVGQARHLHDLAWARDNRPVVAESPARSIGHEETFAVDLRDDADLDRELVRLSDAVAERLRRAALTGRTVQLKVRFGDFRTITRSATPPDGVQGARALLATARRLLGAVDTAPGVRLLGVSVSGLRDDVGHQMRLDGLAADGEMGWVDRAGADAVVGRVRDRFGASAIVSATLAGRGAKRRGDTQWGPVAPLDVAREAPALSQADGRAKIAPIRHAQPPAGRATAE